MLAIKVLGEEHYRLDLMKLGEFALVPTTSFYAIVKRSTLVCNGDGFAWEGRILDENNPDFDQFVGYFDFYLSCQVATQIRLRKLIEAAKEEQK